MKTKRLEILENSLAKKQQQFDKKLKAHFADVKRANGQPLNDKRNGQATLNRWDKQNEALKNLEASIKKTKEAIEKEQYKIANVEDAKENLPQVILDLLETKELNQWRRHPNTFFVKGVEKARIVYLYKEKNVAHRYYKSIPTEEQRKIFKDCYNKIWNTLNDKTELKKEQIQTTTKKNTEPQIRFTSSENSNIKTGVWLPYSKGAFDLTHTNKEDDDFSYDKTHFQIKQGNEIVYEGRYDIGDDTNFLYEHIEQVQNHFQKIGLNKQTEKEKNELSALINTLKMYEIGSKQKTTATKTKKKAELKKIQKKDYPKNLSQLKKWWKQNKGKKVCYKYSSGKKEKQIDLIIDDVYEDRIIAKKEDGQQINFDLGKASLSFTNDYVKIIDSFMYWDYAKAKATTIKKNQPNVNLVASYTQEVRIIKRFVNCIGKPRATKTILNIYRDLEKQISNQKIRKTSPNAEIIRELAKRLKVALEKINSAKLTQLIVTEIKENKDFYDKLRKISQENQRRKAVLLYNRYINIYGERNIDTAKAKRLATSISNAFKKGAIPKTDTFYNELKKALQNINDYLNNKTETIKMQSAELNGLKGGKKSKKKSVNENDNLLFDIERLNTQFNKELKQLINNKLNKNHIFKLGMPSISLLNAGMPNYPIELSASRLLKKSKQEQHPFDLELIQNLPKLIHSPLMVFVSATKLKSLVVVIEIEYKGKNFVIPIKFNENKNDIYINSVRSVYYRKTNLHIIQWIKEGLLLWANKKQTLNWLNKQQYNSADVKQLIKSSANIIKDLQTTNKTEQKSEKNLNGTEQNRIVVDLPQPPTKQAIKPSNAPNNEQKQAPKKPIDNDIFTNISLLDQEQTNDVIWLQGDLGRFLGYVEKYEYSILLRGDKGAGKSRLLFQIMNLFAQHNFKVACFSLEIGKRSNILKSMRDEYIQQNNVHNISIADECPKGLKTIEQAAQHFDVVCIDSWGKIGNTKQDDFDTLRKKYPQTMFVVIFQSTTGKVARGGNMPEYDAGMVIQVNKGGIAVCEKNRYNGEDLEYSVFQQKLILEQTEEQPQQVATIPQPQNEPVTIF